MHARQKDKHHTRALHSAFHSSSEDGISSTKLLKAFCHQHTQGDDRYEYRSNKSNDARTCLTTPSSPSEANTSSGTPSAENDPEMNPGPKNPDSPSAGVAAAVGATVGATLEATLAFGAGVGASLKPLSSALGAALGVALGRASGLEKNKKSTRSRRGEKD